MGIEKQWMPPRIIGDLSLEHAGDRGQTQVPAPGHDNAQLIVSSVQHLHLAAPLGRVRYFSDAVGRSYAG
jgi:hypothetical protein